jgi:hypothetical protein
MATSVMSILLLHMFYVRVGILLTCGKHLHACIISLKKEVWVHKTSLTLPLFMEVPVPIQEHERSCICVLGVSILPLSTILIFDFCNRSESVVCFLLHFIDNVYYFSVHCRSYNNTFICHKEEPIITVLNIHPQIS